MVWRKRARGKVKTGSGEGGGRPRMKARGDEGQWRTKMGQGMDRRVRQGTTQWRDMGMGRGMDQEVVEKIRVWGADQGRLIC